MFVPSCACIREMKNGSYILLYDELNTNKCPVFGGRFVFEKE